MDGINVLPLYDEWKPPYLLARDKELEILKFSIESVLPKHFWIEGGRGLGKTLTVKGFYKPYLEVTNKADVFYFDFRERGINANMERFSASLLGKKTKRISELMDFILGESKREKIVIIFDDVQNLVNIRRDFSPILQDIYELMSGKPFQVILISQLITRTPMDLRKYLSESVISRYQFKTLKFGKYTRSEIKKLLLQRLEYIFGKIEKEYEKICHVIATAVEQKMDGDFRNALNILRCAILDSGGLHLNVVEGILEQGEIDFWREFLIKDLSPHRGFLLFCIALLSNSTKLPGQTLEEFEEFKREGNPPIAFKDLESQYRIVCRKLGITPRSHVMIWRDIEVLWQNGIIEKFVLTKNHPYNYTRTRGVFIRLKDDKKPIISAGQAIDWRSLLG